MVVVVGMTYSRRVGHTYVGDGDGGDGGDNDCLTSLYNNSKYIIDI